MATTDTYSTAGTYTWTCPSAGVVGGTITVKTWGGGAGGGVSSSSREGGGGGGAYSEDTFTPTPGAGYTVVVGAGNGPGVAGGDSYFNTSGTIMAKGGSAGVTITGGAGGLASSSVGTTKFSGGTGGTSGLANVGGGGGSSAGPAANGGNGGAPTAGTAPTGGGAGGAGGSSANGSNGVAPGGGGGGGGGTANNAGNGAAGKVTITYTALSAPSAMAYYLENVVRSGGIV